MKRRRRIYRWICRCHRVCTGASTLTSMNSGRMHRTSSMLSSHISVVTNRSRHLLVTKSSSSLESGKMYSEAIDDVEEEGLTVPPVSGNPS